MDLNRASRCAVVVQERSETFSVVLEFNFLLELFL